jgi:hypothetical protein
VLQCLSEAAALEAYYTPEARLREVVGREHQALRLDAVQELRRVRSACGWFMSWITPQSGCSTWGGWLIVSPTKMAHSPLEPTSGLMLPGVCPGVWMAGTSSLRMRSPSARSSTPRDSSGGAYSLDSPPDPSRFRPHLALLDDHGQLG